MKKLLLFLAVSMVMVSCSSDDNKSINVDPDPASLVGKWKFSRAWFNGQEEDLGCEESTTYDFKAGNVIAIDEYFGSAGNCDHSLSTIAYSYSNNTITISNPTGGYDGGLYMVKYEILSMTEDKLKIEAVYETDEVVPGNGPYEDSPYEGDIPEQYRWTKEFSKQ